MDGSFLGDAFGSRGSGFGGGKPAQGLWESLDQLRTMFEPRVRTPTRVGKGDVRTAVLVLLAEQPMHGYQIMAQIEERSGGAWKPSAGSVYPTLQLLVDEGLVTSEESGGRKTYSLTATGREEAEMAAEKAAPWESFGGRDGRGGPGALPKAGMELAQAAAQVGRTGTPEQVRQAVDVLDDARRRLYAILAQD